jgi:predicted RNase H-like nuclease (RuvC/YqgF family)
MFKFVNLQSNEIEELEAEVFELSRELRSTQSDEGHDADKDRYVSDFERSLVTLKGELENTKSDYLRNQS